MHSTWNSKTVKCVNSIREIEPFRQVSPEEQKQNRLSITNNEMILQEIEKSKFAQINDKRYYFVAVSRNCATTLFSPAFCMKLLGSKETNRKKLKRFYSRKNKDLLKWKNLQ